MMQGPQLVLAIDRARAPTFLAEHFDAGEIHIDGSDDDGVQVIQSLMDEGHAIRIPLKNTRFLHVTSDVTSHLRARADPDADAEDRTNDEDENDESDKEDGASEKEGKVDTVEKSGTREAADTAEKADAAEDVACAAVKKARVA